MFVTAMVWKKLLGLRSEFRRQLKKEKKPSGLAGGCSRPWKFLRSLSFLRSVIVPRKTADNLTKPRLGDEDVNAESLRSSVFRRRSSRARWTIRSSIQTRQLANTRVRSSPPAAALRQDMPQRRTFMYGKSSAVGAKVAAAQIIPRKAIFCIDNLSRSCSVDDIKSFVSSLSVKVLSCFDDLYRGRYWSAFC